MGNCAHSDPPEVFERAEAWLERRGVPRERWPGMQIRHGENTPGGRWESVVIDIERRGEEWWVTNIDRRGEPLADDVVGLSVL